jgi:tetratricopeptide (TPR) repeat protein/predicted Ser/Thr protein kinase
MRELGAGGMGVVYEAWDEELGIAVALKVIRPEVGADSTHARELEARFKRELLLARQVTHRNVVRIHDIGEVEGTKYITMSYVEGRDLATMLQGAGRLPVLSVLSLVRQVAAGLQAAHDAGVVHRDLKPANIMVEGDVAVIMDFGIARQAPRTLETGSASISALARARTALVTGATLQGAVVGTVAYMAPEQARGQAVDHRADIYALGMITRDMLAGMRQWTDPTAALAELTLRMEHAPPSLRIADPTIPEAVDAIVTRCLQPDPAARYQSTGELIGDLDALDAEGRPLPKVHRLTKRLIGASAAVVLVLLSGTWWLARTPEAPVQPPPMSVLVADFDNRTGDAMLQGAVEQTLSMALEGASFITSYPRGGAHQLLGQLEAGRKLDESGARLIALREGIKVVLAGSIAPDGAAYKITVRTVDPGDGKVLGEASERASGKVKLLEAVGSLAADIRGELGDTKPASERLAEAETFTAASMEAVKSYSTGQELSTSGKNEEAILHYRRAVEQDPAFGRAYSGWATSAWNIGRREEAAEQYKKALTLLDRMTEREKFRTLGSYYLGASRNYDKAIENYTELVSRYPADRAGYSNLAFAYFSARNFTKALEHGRRAIEIDPKRVSWRNNYALYAMYAGDFRTASAEAQRVLEQDPGFHRARLSIAVGAIVAGDVERARREYAEMPKGDNRARLQANLGLADLAMYLGRPADAVKILETGVAADERAKNTDAIGPKKAALSEAYLAAGSARRSVQAVRQALASTAQQLPALPAVRTLISIGRTRDASVIAAGWGAQLQPQNRAYAKIIEGEIALSERRIADAVEALRAAQKFADLWLGRFDLGVAYVEAGYYAEAVSELELCQKRRGEATALLLDDLPTVRYLATLPYWLARAQEGLGMTAAAAQNYNAFLALRPEAADALTADARRRVSISQP